MDKWFIYLDKHYDKKTKEPLVTRAYYKKKLNKVPPNLTYVGEAMLTDDYFIIGSETHTTDIVDLRDIELEYSAAVVDGSVSYFRHNLQDMLIKAKEGFYPYINFKGFKVNRKPKLVIKGKVHRVHNNKIISYDE